jgi:antibiotic biosynthesis monooxygenase (ABM) superfamily enzyme
MTTATQTFNPAAAKPAMPKRHRMTLLVLIGVYPIITAILYALAPLTAGWDVWQRTLVLAPVMAVIMVYGLIPFIQTRFRGWLTGK